MLLFFINFFPKKCLHMEKRKSPRISISLCTHIIPFSPAIAMACMFLPLSSTEPPNSNVYIDINIFIREAKVHKC